MDQKAEHGAGPDSAQLPLPLSGIRVLDLSQVMAGPFCCMLLGDMGADVVKVEPPGVGDQTRKSMGFRMKGEDSPGFLALNRNKRSITINLKTEAGKKVFYELAKTADVVVENSRPGVAKRLGVDFPTLAAMNSRLVYASISGFGQTGPWSLRPGFDLIAQAMSGIISATGLPGADPVKSGVPVGDLGAGLFATYGILCALVGRGQYRARAIPRHITFRRSSRPFGLGDHRTVGHRTIAGPTGDGQPDERTLSGLQRIGRSLRRWRCQSTALATIPGCH